MHERIFGIAACILVAAGIVLAFTVIGPPGHARLIAMDERRLADIDAISSGMMEQYGGAKRSVPAHLPADLIARDPQTHKPYRFARIGTRRYRVCALFALPSEKNPDATMPPDKAWAHGPGLTCYTFDVSRSTPQT